MVLFYEAGYFSLANDNILSTVDVHCSLHQLSVLAAILKDGEAHLIQCSIHFEAIYESVSLRPTNMHSSLTHLSH